LHGVVTEASSLLLVRWGDHSLGRQFDVTLLVQGVSRMGRRDLLTDNERRALFGVPLDRASLAKFYTVADVDRPLIETRRGAANQLGIALQLALLRHPGFSLRHDERVPDLRVEHIATQLGLSAGAFLDYGRRPQTRLEHAWEAITHLGLRTFEAADVSTALDIATQAAGDTDQGLTIAAAIVDALRAAHTHSAKW
jgi:hypothetical protein